MQKNEKVVNPLDQGISEIVKILKEGKEAEEIEARDNELVRLAKEHRSREASPIVSSTGNKEDYIKSDGDYIPVGLSDTDKEILRDFYGKR